MSRLVDKADLIELTERDYLLPTRGGWAMWRIAIDDEPPEGGADGPLRTSWGVWRWRWSYAPVQHVDDPDDWDPWRQVMASVDTLALAVESAVRMSP